MFKSPDRRLSASSSSVLSAEAFVIPIDLRSAGRTSGAAFEGLRRTFEEVRGFLTHLEKTAPEVHLIDLDETLSSKLSRVEVFVRGKEHCFELSFAFECPFLERQDLWARVQLVSAVYDRLIELSVGIQNRKEIELFFGEASLDREEEPRRLRK